MFALESNPRNSAQLLAKLSQLKTELQIAGAPYIEPTIQSFDRFADSPNEIQERILNNITTYLQTLSQNIEPTESKRIQEIARLKHALRNFGMKSLHEDIFNQIAEDDVIEIYSSQGIQLYRNMKFLKLCSYSLLDLAVNPWDQLYEKPTLISTKIMEKIDHILTHSTGPVPYETGTFIQRETYIFAKTLRVFKVTPRFLSATIDQFGKRNGFISTYDAEIFSEGIQSLKVKIFS